MFPVAAVCGNTMVVKPSERDPGATMMLMELANEAGFPPGVVNVIHGAHSGLSAYKNVHHDNSTTKRILSLLTLEAHFH